MNDDDRLVCVHRSPDPIDANILRGVLEIAGIPVTLTGEGLVGAYSGVPKLADVCVMVPNRVSGHAKLVIESYENRAPGSPADEWHCAHCGEENAGEFEICWRCARAPGDDQGTDQA